MITNQEIIEMIEQQTVGEPILRKFLLDLLNKENEGGQFTKIYKKLIEDSVKEQDKYAV